MEQSGTDLLSNGDNSWWLELQVNCSTLRLADGAHLERVRGEEPVRQQLEHGTNGHPRSCT